MIEQYGFGKIVIDGKVYTHDVIICPDRVIENWWRKSGHYLQLEDIEDTIKKRNMNMVVIGTGKFGLMKVAPEVEDYFKYQQILFFIQPSGKAVRIFNQKSKETDSVIGAFHLTC